jgi:peroxiredoxin
VAPLGTPTVMCVMLILALIGTPWSVEASARTDARPTGFQVFDNPSRANDVEIVTTNGEGLKLSDLEGKVVLLNFWRKDCPYCEQEKGYLKRLKQSLGKAGLNIVCVNFSDEPAWVTRYASKTGSDLVFAVLPEGKKRILEGKVRGKVLGYHLVNGSGEAIYEIKGFPSTYVINKEGRVIATHLGMARWHAAPVREWISGLVQADSTAKMTFSPDYEVLPWMDRLLNWPTDGGFPLETGSTVRIGAGSRK